jgi:hypothetical protein
MYIYTHTPPVALARPHAMCTQRTCTGVCGRIMRDHVTHIYVCVWNFVRNYEQSSVIKSFDTQNVQFKGSVSQRRSAVHRQACIHTHTPLRSHASHTHHTHDAQCTHHIHITRGSISANIAHQISTNCVSINLQIVRISSVWDRPRPQINPKGLPKKFEKSVWHFVPKVCIVESVNTATTKRRSPWQT